MFLRFSTCCLLLWILWSIHGTQWGDTILSLSESCLLSNPVGKTTKMSSSKKVILQMYSIYFSFEDMTSVKIWRDEIKAAENLLFTPAVVKNGYVFEICSGSQIRNPIPTLRIIWKFHVNIANAQVNPLCSCQSSRAVLIIGRRKFGTSSKWYSFFSI